MCMHVCVCVCVCTHAFGCAVRMYVCMYISMLVPVCMSVHVRMRVFGGMHFLTLFFVSDPWAMAISKLMQITTGQDSVCQVKDATQ